jgi:hypothetical protein
MEEIKEETKEEVKDETIEDTSTSPNIAIYITLGVAFAAAVGVTVYHVRRERNKELDEFRYMSDNEYRLFDHDSNWEWFKMKISNFFNFFRRKEEYEPIKTFPEMDPFLDEDF